MATVQQILPLIAVIEDDPNSAEALSLILRDWGAEVVLAKSAAGIITKLGGRTTQLRAIITDFNLGAGDDGVTGLKPLLIAAPETPVLVLSGSFHGKATVAAHIAGYPLLAKPATPEAIIAWLEKS